MSQSTCLGYDLLFKLLTVAGPYPWRMFVLLSPWLQASGPVSQSASSWTAGLTDGYCLLGSVTVIIFTKSNDYAYIRFACLSSSLRIKSLCISTVTKVIRYIMYQGYYILLTVCNLVSAFILLRRGGDAIARYRLLTKLT